MRVITCNQPLFCFCSPQIEQFPKKCSVVMRALPLEAGSQAGLFFRLSAQHAVERHKRCWGGGKARLRVVVPDWVRLEAQKRNRQHTVDFGIVIRKDLQHVIRRSGTIRRDPGLENRGRCSTSSASSAETKEIDYSVKVWHRIFSNKGAQLLEDNKKWLKQKN